MQTNTERLLPLPAVMERTSLKRASLYAAIDRGEFPKPVRIGANRVAWPESVISAWIAEKIALAEVHVLPPTPRVRRMGQGRIRG
jgi:prophage regulatory protein